MKLKCIASNALGGGQLSGLTQRAGDGPGVVEPLALGDLQHMTGGANRRGDLDPTSIEGGQPGHASDSERLAHFS